MNYISKEEKAKWLEKWRRSGKKAWTYAKENGLVPQTFCSWVKGRSKTKSGFVEIQPRVITATQSSVIIVEKGEVKIHIPLGMNSSELRVVMEGLVVAL